RPGARAPAPTPTHGPPPPPPAEHSRSAADAEHSGPAPGPHPAGPATDFVPSRDLAAYTADRLPRTTAIVRKAARTGAVTLLAARPAVALRSALVSAVSRFGPGLVLRGFDGIADWRPPVAPARSA
ncbi:monooxygenase, partial [Streptomyces sp. NPDC059556]